jgi:hypothetical protein
METANASTSLTKGLPRLAPSGRSRCIPFSNKRIVLRLRIESPQSVPQNFSKTLIADFLKKGQHLGLNRGDVPAFIGD